MYKIYVCGRFNEALLTYGAGAVITKGEKIIATYNDSFCDKIVTMKSLAGELKAIIWALDWLKKRPPNQVSIIHQSSTLKQWVAKNYTKDNPYVINYIQLYKELSQTTNFHFKQASFKSENPFKVKTYKLATSALKKPPLRENGERLASTPAREKYQKKVKTYTKKWKPYRKKR